MERNIMNFFRLSLFIVLGLVLQQLVHHLIESLYISLLIDDFDKYSLGLSWDAWFRVHHILGACLLVMGAWSGYRLGKIYLTNIENGSNKLV